MKNIDEEIAKIIPHCDNVIGFVSKMRCITGLCKIKICKNKTTTIANSNHLFEKKPSLKTDFVSERQFQALNH